MDATRYLSQKALMKSMTLTRVGVLLTVALANSEVFEHPGGLLRMLYVKHLLSNRLKPKKWCNNEIQ